MVEPHFDQNPAIRLPGPGPGGASSASAASSIRDRGETLIRLSAAAARVPRLVPSATGLP